MGFHYTIAIGDDEFTWKCSHDDVELIYELERDYGVTSELSRSACSSGDEMTMESIAQAMAMLMQNASASDRLKVAEQEKEILQLMAEHGVSESGKQIAQSATITVREFGEEIDAMFHAMSAHKDMLFMSYLIKIFNPKSGRFRKFKHKDEWSLQEWNEGKSEIVAISDLSYGKRECQLTRTVFEGQQTLSEEITDLRGFDEYTLPDGARIIIEQAPREDTLSEPLRELRDWILDRDPDAPVRVMSG